jgi:hypothetical protein
VKLEPQPGGVNTLDPSVPEFDAEITKRPSASRPLFKWENKIRDDRGRLGANENLVAKSSRE